MLNNSRIERKILSREQNKTANVKVVNLPEVQPVETTVVKNEPEIAKDDVIDKSIENVEKSPLSNVDEMLEAKVKRWFDRIMRNTSQYAVTTTGEILKDTAEPFRRSSVKESIRYLITKNGTSPPGTSLLKQRLLTDSFFAHQLDSQYGTGWRRTLW